MGLKDIEGVVVTPLAIVDVKGGDVLHAMKTVDEGFSGFGEAYFSKVNYGAVKGWKRHRQMTLNLIVPQGKVRFVLFDDRASSLTNGHYQDIVLSLDQYQRLTVPPLVWGAFQGLAEPDSLLLNIASIPHDPTEADQKPINQFEYEWMETK